MKTKFKDTEIGMIPEDWEVKELNEVVTKLGDGLHGTPKYNDKGDYYFINGNNLVKGRIKINENTKKCSEEEYKKYKKELNNRTIFVSINGTLGNVALYHNEKVILGKSACYFNLKEGFNLFYVKHVLNDDYFQSYIYRNATGTTIKNVSLKLMREFKFKIPKLLEEQKAIAKILSDLDSKIELLQKQNKTLEAIGQALFKYWFVDFEFPNEEGKPYKSSGGEMVDSELGEIPKGWVVKELGDFVDVQKGLSYKGKFLSEEGIPMSNLGTFKPLAGFKSDGLKHYTGEYKERHLVVPGDLIVANTDITQKRDVLGSPALIPQNIGSDRALFTHHIFAIRHKQNNLTNYFIYFLLQTPEYRSRAIGFATGTTVLALPKEAILNLLFAVAPENLITKFNDMAKFSFNKLELNNQQIQTLQKIRDTLLPKLMSGEIRVLNNQKIKEAV